MKKIDLLKDTVMISEDKQKKLKAGTYKPTGAMHHDNWHENH